VDRDEPTRFTTADWWDEYWHGTPLPQRIDFGTSAYVDRLLDVLMRYLPDGAGERSALEIGGAPGRYLAFMHDRGFAVTALEYSPVGVELTRENFRRLGIPGRVLHGDMFDQELDVPLQDVVYSLGLIEHFDDPTAVARAHARLVEPGGILVIGAPNLMGLSRRLHRRLSPSVLESHHWPATDPARWEAFERELGLDVLFKQYIGGFEPGVFGRIESDSLVDRALWRGLQLLRIPLNHRWAGVLRDRNSVRWSGYVMAVYRVAGQPRSGELEGGPSDRRLGSLP
jgi:SAM-dependent methyltransferase